MRVVIIFMTLAAVTACNQQVNPLSELSGLVPASNGASYWALNDGPNTSSDRADSTLYRIDSAGNVLQRVTVSAANHDWEDLSALTIQDKRFLVVADVGDNKGVRDNYELLIVAEPAPNASNVSPAWAIRFHYPTSSKDCESVAFDPVTSSLILVTKREVPPTIYRLPLEAAGQSPDSVTAEPVGTISGLVGATWLEKLSNPWQGPYAAQPTALDITPDLLALLTYKSLYIWRRGGVALFEGAPTVIPLPKVAQWESVAIVGSQIVVGREDGDALLTIPVPHLSP